MQKIFINEGEFLVSILCVKSKFERETYGISIEEFFRIKESFIGELNVRSINASILSCYDIIHFGQMHGTIFVVDGITLEELTKIYKGVSPQEVTDLIWDEELICKVANISKNEKVKKKK